jgi:hypothetical protein
VHGVSWWTRGWDSPHLSAGRSKTVHGVEGQQVQRVSGAYVERAELRERKRRKRLLEQENEVLRRGGGVSVAGEPAGKMMTRSSVTLPRPARLCGCRSR